ncbi:hypothetical protein LEP1GSC195_0192 [Leptospira wolbachii serovar Codice str. CDC]|uniref:Uncharacterized protein n=1 Tax=Leptospira wolbachii serovar Codice str. CDC TaxID=1218599 RepID=R9A606_9LEPT|nr:hypothetical protein LEP1GSC195_0192 [Leptospira wolbachii serovar Codice str. CDC]
MKTEKKRHNPEKIPSLASFVPGLMHTGVNLEEKKSGIREGWVHP